MWNGFVSLGIGSSSEILPTNTTVHVINDIDLLCLRTTVKRTRWGPALQAERSRVRLTIRSWLRDRLFFWHCSVSWTLAFSKIVLHLVSIFRSVSKQYIFKGVGWYLHTQPPPGGTECPFLIGSLPLTCLAWEAPPVVMLLAAQVSWSFDRTSLATVSKRRYLRERTTMVADSAPKRNEYQGYPFGGKGGRCVGLTTLPPSFA